MLKDPARNSPPRVRRKGLLILIRATFFFILSQKRFSLSISFLSIFISNGQMTPLAKSAYSASPLVDEIAGNELDSALSAHHLAKGGQKIGAE